MPEETPPVAKITSTNKTPPPAPVRTEPDLSARFSECCQPGGVDASTLSQHKFYLIRGGENVDVINQKVYKPDASRYFLVQVEKVLTSDADEDGDFMLFGPALEVFPKEGQKLVFDSNETKLRGTTTVVVEYDKKVGIPASTIASIKPEYEEEWGHLFDRIFKSNLPLTPAAHSDKIGYEAAMGNIHSLSDGMTLASKNLNLDNLRKEPLALRDVMINGVYKTEHNLLDLEAMKERRGISKILAEKITGEPDTRPYSVMSQSTYNDRMDEVFGLKSVYAPAADATVTKLPNRHSTQPPLGTKTEKGDVLWAQWMESQKETSKAWQIYEGLADLAGSTPTESQTNARDAARATYKALSDRSKGIKVAFDKEHALHLGGLSTKEIDNAASLLPGTKQLNQSRLTQEAPASQTARLSSVGRVPATGGYRADTPGTRDVYIAEYISGATPELIDEKIKSIQDAYRAKRVDFLNDEVWDTFPTLNEKGEKHTSLNHLVSLINKRDEIVDQILDAEGINDVSIAEYGSIDYGGGAFVVMPQKIHGSPGGRILNTSEFSARLTSYGDSAGARNVSDDLEFQMDPASAAEFENDMAVSSANLLQAYDQGSQEDDSDNHLITEHKAHLAENNAAANQADIITAEARWRAGLPANEVYKNHKQTWMEARASALIQDAEKKESAESRAERGQARDARALNLAVSPGAKQLEVNNINARGRTALARAQNSGERIIIAGHSIDPGVIVPLGTNQDSQSAYISDSYRKAEHAAGYGQPGEEMYGAALPSLREAMKGPIESKNVVLIRYNGVEMPLSEYHILTANLPSKDYNPETDKLFMDARLLPGVHSAGHTSIDYRFLTQVLSGDQTPDSGGKSGDSVKKIQTILADMESQLEKIGVFKDILSDLSYVDPRRNSDGTHTAYEMEKHALAQKKAAEFETTMLHLRAKYRKLGDTQAVAQLDKLSSSVSDMSMAYAGGHQINPIELIHARKTMKGTIGEQLKYQTETLFPNEVFDKDNPPPNVDDFIQWMRDSPNTISRIVNPRRARRNSGTRNAWEFTRSVVNRYVQARGWQYHEFDPDSTLTNVPKPTMPTPHFEQLTLTNDEGEEYDRPIASDSADPISIAVDNIAAGEKKKLIKPAAKIVHTGHSVYSILAGLTGAPAEKETDRLSARAKKLLSENTGLSEKEKTNRFVELFGYQYKKDGKGKIIADSFAPITSDNFQQMLEGKRKEYTVSDNRLKTHFEMVHSMTGEQVAEMADKMGLPLQILGGPIITEGRKKRQLPIGNKNIFAPITNGAPAGYYDFVTELEKANIVPEGKMDSEPLSSAQYQILQHLQEHKPLFNLNQGLLSDTAASRKLLTQVFDDPSTLGTLPPLEPREVKPETKAGKTPEAEQKEKGYFHPPATIGEMLSDTNELMRTAQYVKENGGQIIVRGEGGPHSLSINPDSRMASFDGVSYNVDGPTLVPVPAHAVTSAANSSAFVGNKDAQSVIYDARRSNLETRRKLNQNIQNTRQRIDNGEYLVNDPELLRSDSGGVSELWKNSKQMLDKSLSEDLIAQSTLKRESALLKARRNAAQETPKEVIPLYEASIGNKRVILPPKDHLDSAAGDPKTFARFIEKIHYPEGATIIGFDIENATKDRLDKDGNRIWNKKKQQFEQDSDLITSVGGRTGVLKSDGSLTFKDNGMDLGTSNYVQGRQNEFGISDPDSIASLRPVQAKGYSEEDALLLETEKYFRNAFRLSPDAYVAVFNTRHDLPLLIKQGESSASVEAQQAAHYLQNKVLPRVLEASHFAVLSDIQRKDTTLSTFGEELLGTKQTHTALNDVNRMLLVMAESIKRFTTGESGPLTVQPAKKVYVFPKHVTPEDGVMGGQGQIDRLNQSKAPFQVTRVVKEDRIKADGSPLSVYQTYGKRIDESGKAYGPEEKRLGNTPGAGQFQLNMTQNGYFSTDEAGLEDAWKSHLTDDVLGDLVGRNVRRMSDAPLGWHQGQVREDVNRGVYSKRDDYIARGRIARQYDDIRSEQGKEDFIEHIKQNLSGGKLSPEVHGEYHPLNPLMRPDGTIDTSTAQSVYDWITASPGTTQQNPGFSDPHERYIIGRTGEVLEERAKTVDKDFVDTIHASYRAGELSPEEYTRAARGYHAHMDAGFTSPLMKEQPASVTSAASVFLKTQRSTGGATKVTELKTDMSEEDIFEKLFDHAAATQSVPAKIMTSLGAKGADTAAIIAKEAEGMSMSMAKGLRLHIAASAPELNHIADKEDYSLQGLAKDIHTAFASGSFDNKKRGAVDSLNTEMPFVADTDEKATQAAIRNNMDMITGMSWTPAHPLEGEEGKAQSAFHHRRYAEILSQKAGSEHLGTATFARAEQYSNEATAPYLGAEQRESLLTAIKSVDTEAIPSSTIFNPPTTPYNLAQRAMDKEPELIKNASPVLQERAQAESAEAISDAIAGMSSRSKIGYALGVAALTAGAAYMGNAMIQNKEKRDGIVSPTVPSSTHDHDAGAQDEELATEGSDSQTAGLQGWRKLHIEVDVSHPGFSGSDSRMDSQALQAFSTDVSSVLTKHFGGSYDPDGSATTSSAQQDDTSKNRIGDILMRAHSRMGG